MHKHLSKMQLICTNVMFDMLLSDGGNSQSGTSKNPMRVDMRTDKESNP